jgi:predicted nucleic acid-binding protein
MIAADTSSWVAFFEGDEGEDVVLLERALADSQLRLPAPVLTELLSNPRLDADTFQDLVELPLLEPTPGYWARAGRLRARVLARKRKARLGDALIAQLCLDSGARLISRDGDFAAFASAAGLDLMP